MAHSGYPHSLKAARILSSSIGLSSSSVHSVKEGSYFTHSSIENLLLTTMTHRKFLKFVYGGNMIY